MKIFVFFLLCAALMTTTRVNAQATYTTHTIEKGETLSILAQKFHTSVGDIMRLNGMNAKSQLKTGEKIKIPTHSGAKTQTTKTAAATSDTIAETHYVLQGETLYSISKKFGVTIDQLKEWNHLQDDNIHFGQLLAVRAEGKKLVDAKYPSSGDAPVPGQNAATETVIDDTSNSSAVTGGDPQAQQPSVTVVENQKDSGADENPPASETVIKPVSNVKDQAKTETTVSVDSYFSNDAANVGDNSLSGEARTFKTASGWTDKKYYILANGIEPGKIVRVSGNGRNIYAKVLWQLGDSKTNDGLSFRISDAAALALGLYMPEFNLNVTY